ncbi:MAG: DUF559 domain-containing protein [Candidatus Altiarchaeales archaeon]|nr:DUF559 domain-containing protein [Candidatus Altiarchaeales archaeon]MBD3416794.1 DUF559 domain-containing protein [Candidatus Altiarchaeales archaeon]
MDKSVDFMRGINSPIKPPSPDVSERMSRVKRQGSKLEKAMEKILKKEKIKYIYQPNVYGHPDFQVSGSKIVLFCDSSFWHGRREKEVSGEAFNRNRKFWVEKLRANKARDKRTNRKLRRDGWSVLRFWDDDILKNPQKVINKINKKIDEKCRVN